MYEDILGKVGSKKGVGWLKIKCLKVGSDWDSWILTGNEFQTLGMENQKARDPNVKLWRETESWWELDERRDLVGSHVAIGQKDMADDQCAKLWRSKWKV